MKTTIKVIEYALLMAATVAVGYLIKHQSDEMRVLMGGMEKWNAHHIETIEKVDKINAKLDGYQPCIIN